MQHSVFRVKNGLWRSIGKLKLWWDSFLNLTEGNIECLASRPKHFTPEKRVCDTKRKEG